MKVETDNLEEALRIVKNEYPNLELTSEWLDARDITIKENQVIMVCPKDLQIYLMKTLTKKV